MKTFYGTKEEILIFLENMLKDYWHWFYKYSPAHNTLLAVKQMRVGADDIANRWINSYDHLNHGDPYKMIRSLTQRLNQAGYRIDIMSTEEDIVGIAYEGKGNLRQFYEDILSIEKAGIYLQRNYLC